MALKRHFLKSLFRVQCVYCKRYKMKDDLRDSWPLLSVLFYARSKPYDGHMAMGKTAVSVIPCETELLRRTPRTKQ
eukprot:2557706-Amphidinium_carterae.1